MWLELGIGSVALSIGLLFGLFLSEESFLKIVIGLMDIGVGATGIAIIEGVIQAPDAEFIGRILFSIGIFTVIGIILGTGLRRWSGVQSQSFLQQSTGGQSHVVTDRMVSEALTRVSATEDIDEMDILAEDEFREEADEIGIEILGLPLF